MSTSATTSAKRRRAGPLTVQPVPPGPSLSRAPARATPPIQGNVLPPTPPAVAPSVRALSVQQAISLIDNRLLTLEKIALEQSKRADTAATSETMRSIIQDALSEFNHRYELLATELVELKETVLKLQSYTMDINKSLIHERIQILSDISEHKINKEDDEYEVESVNSVEEDVDLQNELGEEEAVDSGSSVIEPVTQDMMDAEVLLRGLRLSS